MMRNLNAGFSGREMGVTVDVVSLRSVECDAGVELLSATGVDALGTGDCCWSVSFSSVICESEAGDVALGWWEVTGKRTV